MNCEMAQRIIALAALAPAHPRHPSPRDPGWMVGQENLSAGSLEQQEAEALAGLEAEFGEFDFASEAELAETERLALEEHLAGCRECQAEMASTAAFYRALSLTHQPEPTPSLLARARMRLDATLDTNAHQSVIAHLLQQLSFSAGRLRASPGLASGLLLVGLAVGGYGGYRAGNARHVDEQRTILGQPEESAPIIAQVSSIVRDPDSEEVEVRYKLLVPDTVTGSLDDPFIRHLLVLAMQNGVDSSVRDDSINLLADECRHGHSCTGGLIRNALLSALRGDRNPEVRAVALDGLEPYIAEDMQVRDAVVRAVMADSSAAVRIEAIRLLTPVEVDSSVRQALHTVAAKDGDPQIRDASQQVLNGIPQLQ